jgi:hypothetical protein
MHVSPKHLGGYHGSEKPSGFIRTPARQLGHTHVLGMRDLARAFTHWAGRSVYAYTAPQAIRAFVHLEDVYHSYLRCGTVDQQQTKSGFHQSNTAFLASCSSHSWCGYPNLSDPRYYPADYLASALAGRSCGFRSSAYFHRTCYYLLPSAFRPRNT